MKILQVVPYFPPAYSFGGPVKVAFDFSKKLAKRGHEVVVYTSDAKDLDSRLNFEPVRIFDGIKVHYMKNLSMLPVKKSKLFITPELVSKVKKEIKEFDIVHLHEYRSFQNIVVHNYAKKYGVPYILQAHGSLPRISKQKLKWIYDAFFGNRLLKDASKVIALNKTEAEQYRGLGVPDEKTAIIPNGIDLSEYSDLPSKGEFKRKFNIAEDKKIILYLGRIHESKGIDLLIKAFSILVNRLKPIEIILAIVGPDEGYLDDLKSLAGSLGILDSILSTGFVSVEDKRKVLLDADIFVTPSFSGFPITFLESCATGTPIITTTLGDDLDWIDNKSGYVTHPTPSNLADSMYKLLIDCDLRNKFSENCKAIVKSKFSLDVVIDKLEHLYAHAYTD